MNLRGAAFAAADAYLTVQQIYRGRALFGIAIGGALASSLWLAIAARRRRRAAVWAALNLVAFVSLLVSLLTLLPRDHERPA